MFLERQEVAHANIITLYPGYLASLFVSKASTPEGILGEMYYITE